MHYAMPKPDEVALILGVITDLIEQGRIEAATSALEDLCEHMDTNPEIYPP
jgi:hypothetical protein